jgi:hypothetical protein
MIDMFEMRLKIQRRSVNLIVHSDGELIYFFFRHCSTTMVRIVLGSTNAYFDFSSSAFDLQTIRE